MRLNLDGNISEQLWINFATQNIGEEIKKDPVAMEHIEIAYKGGMASMYLFITTCLADLPQEKYESFIDVFQQQMKVLTDGISINRDNMN